MPQPILPPRGRTAAPPSQLPRGSASSTARRRIRAWQGPDMPASRPRLRRPRLRRPRLRRPKLRQQIHRRPKPLLPGTGPERGQMSKRLCWLSPSASPSAAARVMPIARAAPAAQRAPAGRRAQGPNTSFAMPGFSGRISMPALRICVSRRHCGPGSCRARSFDRRPFDKGQRGLGQPAHDWPRDPRATGDLPC